MQTLSLKVQPLARELAAVQQLGKSLPESIVECVLEGGGVAAKLTRLRAECVTREELPLLLEQ